MCIRDSSRTKSGPHRRRHARTWQNAPGNTINWNLNCGSGFGEDALWPLAITATRECGQWLFPIFPGKGN
eukprot:9681396-Alexandrium_andersonii.AAC.1